MSIEDYNNAPELIRYLMLMGHCGIPVGMGVYNEAIEKHPEYFPEVVGARKLRDDNLNKDKI